MYAYDESPFVPLRTRTSGTTNPDKDAEIARKDAEIARLRAELDAAKAEAKDATGCFMSLLDDAKRLRSDLSSARAALDKEREACDEYRESHRPDCSDETLGGRGPHATDHRCRKCREYDARRAAEAKE